MALGADTYEARVAFDGKTGVFIGIQVAPSANLLTVINGVKAAFPEIQAQLPHGPQRHDRLRFHRLREQLDPRGGHHRSSRRWSSSWLVIFAFLGSPRSVLIPIVAIPLSLVGTFGIMLALGFSINLLTLLALVLAIGLVVDDAIIVVENVNRHLEGGMAPVAAASLAARELAGPIVAMTVGIARGFRPDRLSGRPDRRAVRGVRLHPRRRGDGVGGDRADPVAHDVLAAAQAAPSGRQDGKPASCGSSTPLRRLRSGTRDACIAACATPR